MNRCSGWLLVWLGGVRRCRSRRCAQAPVLEPAPPGIEAAELSRRAAEALAGRAHLPRGRALGPRSRTARRRTRSGSAPGWSGAAAGASCACSRRRGEAGTGLLRLPPNLWRYAPLTASVELLDPAPAGRALARQRLHARRPAGRARGAGDGPARLLGVDPALRKRRGGESALRARARARAAAAADGRVIAWIGTRARDAAALRSARCAATRSSPPCASTSCARSRAARFRTAGRSRGPAAPQRESRIELREIRFDPAFDDAIFTTRQLLQRGRNAPPRAAAPDARLGAPGGSPP